MTHSAPGVGALGTVQDIRVEEWQHVVDVKVIGEVAAAIPSAPRVRPA